MDITWASVLVVASYTLVALERASNVLTGVASVIAIYLFIAKREQISTAVRLLLSYAFQTTLNELNQKLDRLNDQNADVPEERGEVRSILHEIAGQVRGNKRLQGMAPNIIERLEALANSRKLSDPLKRSMVSEIRECLRHLQVSTVESTRKVK